MSFTPAYGKSSILSSTEAVHVVVQVQWSDEGSCCSCNPDAQLGLELECSYDYLDHEICFTMSMCAQAQRLHMARGNNSVSVLCLQLPVYVSVG